MSISARKSLITAVFFALVIPIRGAAGQENKHKIIFHAVEYRETQEGLELRSWRQVNLRQNAGRKYGVEDIFFAEHAPRYHITTIKPGFVDKQAKHSVRYIVKGNEIDVLRSDIESDRCYSLNNFSMIKTLRGLAAKTKAAFPQINNEVNDFVASQEKSGYVVVEAKAEMVRSFLRTRVRKASEETAEKGQQVPY